MDNFAFFSTLLMDVIGRSFQVDLTSDPGTALLYRVTKVHAHMYNIHVHTVEDKKNFFHSLFRTTEKIKHCTESRTVKKRLQ